MYSEFVRHNSQSNLPPSATPSSQSSTFHEFQKKSCNTYNQGSSQQLEYYSFNNANQNHYQRSSQSNRNNNESCDKNEEPRYQKLINTYRSGDEKSQELMVKYSSLCQELRSVDNGELMSLLVEEIQENQRNRRVISQRNRKIQWLEQELRLLQQNLQQKREAIQQLCETESKNLDLIESMQKKLRNKGFVLNDYYYSKYTQLQKYMSDYICSTKQAQEQFLKKISLMKKDNSLLLEDNQNLAREVFELTKLKDILGMKITKKDASLIKIHQEEGEAREMISCLQEEILMMKKDIEVLIENLKSYEQFQIDLNKDNRQISSSLEFLRERINLNGSVRGQIDLQRNCFGSIKNEEVEELKDKIRQLNSDKEIVLQQYQEVKEAYEAVHARLEGVEKENFSLLAIVDENNKFIGKLKGESEVVRKNGEQDTFNVLRRGHSKPELSHDSLDQSSLKAKSGFITNCNSSSKAAVSRQTALTRFDSKQNESNNF